MVVTALQCLDTAASMEYVPSVDVRETNLIQKLLAWRDTTVRMDSVLHVGGRWAGSGRNL